MSLSALVPSELVPDVTCHPDTNWTNWTGPPVFEPIFRDSDEKIRFESVHKMYIVLSIVNMKQADHHL